MIPFLASFPRRVIVFNPLGRYARAQVAAMRQAGTPIIAGVQLGRCGETLDGLPILDAPPAEADAAVLYTPPDGTADAIARCAALGIRSIIACAEYVPVHDALRAARAAREAGAWLVGPNTLGLCVPGQGMLGNIPPAFCAAGDVTLLTRSGTLALTITRMLTAAGIGQRAVINLGGDELIGRNPHEYLAPLADDAATRAVLYVGELGGDKEYALAEALPALRGKRLVAMVMGRHAPEGRRMGHAGALVGAARETAEAKLAALQAAGACIARTPDEAIEQLGGQA